MQVVFIDEISMVGSGMFNFLDLRLQEAMGTKEPFGGLCIIAVGDLFQLKPVFDHWIFENSKDGLYWISNKSQATVFSNV